MEGASSSKAGRKRYPDTESIQSQDSADAAGSPIGKRQRPNGEQSSKSELTGGVLMHVVQLFYTVHVIGYVRHASI